LFSVGLRIEGQTSRGAKTLIFWTWDFESLRADLEMLGYDVSDGEGGSVGRFFGDLLGRSKRTALTFD
jgi:hypothetical protein